MSLSTHEALSHGLQLLSCSPAQACVRRMPGFATSPELRGPERLYSLEVDYRFVVFIIQGSTKLSPLDHMMHWVFVLVQKDSNAQKESYSCTEPQRFYVYQVFTTQKEEKQKRKSQFFYRCASLNHSLGGHTCISRGVVESEISSRLKGLLKLPPQCPRLINKG
jgi:hypothetical protein